MALEFNRDLVRGKFLKSVLLRAFPAGITGVIVIFAASMLGRPLNFTTAETSTMSAFLLGAVGFLMVFQTSRPFNALRKLLFGVCLVLYVGCAIILPGMFNISPLSWQAWLVTIALIIAAVPIFAILVKVSYAMGAKRPPKFKIKVPAKVSGEGKHS